MEIRASNAGNSPATEPLRARYGRVRGFAPWRPQAKTKALLDQVQAVLAEYRAHLPLTARQIFYRLVGAAGFEKTETAYSRLCETINRARRCGFIPFEAIRDDGAARYEAETWASPEAFLQAVKQDAARFRADRQDGQPVRLWLACEAGGMAPMLYRVAAPFGVPVLTSGGFDSLSAKHELAQDLAAWPDAEVLHIGDLDPSGVHLFSALAEDVGAMVKTLAGHAPRFSRLAVTMEQAEALDLPTAPAKVTDRRAFEGETVQAEAIPPDFLSEIARAAIEARQDAAQRDAVLQWEARCQAELVAALGGLA